MRRHSLCAMLFTGVVGTSLAACGGGGGATSGPPSAPATPIAAPTTTSAPPITSQSVSGTVVSIPQGTYGASASPQTPLAGATVVIGNALIQGPTLPPSLPGNDVITTTDSTGKFTAKVSPPQAPPSSPSLYTFVLPASNVFNVSVPESGYFVMVFPVGADGKSVGAQIPVHAFVAAGAGGALGTFRSTTASVDEAGWLQQANLDRAAKGQSAESFDEYVEETARQHAADMLGEFALCDYNTADQGPQTRYDLLGGLGLDDSAIGIYGGQPTTTSAFWHGVEAAYVAEGNQPPPNNYHFANLMYPYNLWMGLAVATGPWTPPGGSLEQFYASDMDNIDVVNGTALSATVGSCPTGIVANGS